jgi:hypothetical protein
MEVCCHCPVKNDHCVGLSEHRFCELVAEEAERIAINSRVFPAWKLKTLEVSGSAHLHYSKVEEPTVEDVKTESRLPTVEETRELLQKVKERDEVCRFPAGCGCGGGARCGRGYGIINGIVSVTECMLCVLELPRDIEGSLLEIRVKDGAFIAYDRYTNAIWEQKCASSLSTSPT